MPVIIDDRILIKLSTGKAPTQMDGDSAFVRIQYFIREMGNFNSLTNLFDEYLDND